MAKPTYKILKNMPSDNKYGQYVYDYDLPLFWDKTGISTPFQYDDLYTVIPDDLLRVRRPGSGYSSYKFYYPDSDEWGDLRGEEFDEDGNEVFRAWRPISNVYVGNPTDPAGGVYLQEYYDFDDPNYLISTTPNVVNLYFDIARRNYSFNVDQTDYWTILTEHYNNLGANITSEELQSYLNYDTDTAGFAQPIKVKIFNWDWKEGDLDFDSYTMDSPALITDYIWKDNLFTPSVFSHQYEEPGIKIIKAIIYTDFQNEKYGYHSIKNIEIRINLGVDNIYFEDFTVLGGPDFKLLPWPHTTPIIGGISDRSDYKKSLEKILRLNKFSEGEKYQKYLCEKADMNDELGKALGDSDIQQVRLSRYNFDMNYLLGIRDDISTDGYDFNPYYDNNEDGGYWNGEEGYKFSEETSVGSIFIDDIEDSALKSSHLFELNFSTNQDDDDVVFDSAGNGNVGVLIGDYKLDKIDPDIELSRESVMKISKISSNDGAI